MQTTIRSAETETQITRDASGIGRHPAGLTTLFLTEMWERFSYYGMRAILVLYIVAPAAAGGLGFETARATSIYGAYTGAVYLTPILGGWLADRFLSARLAVLLGGIIIAAGHFSMAMDSLPTFYLGMVLIAMGTGLLKPNVTTMVGGLYADGDPRRDSGFSIFYMGINTGATFGALICGYLAQRIGWHLGFAAAGIGMLFGLIQFQLHRRRIAHVGGRPQPRKAERTDTPEQPFTAQEKKRLVATLGLCMFAALFFTAFEQAGSSFNLFAERHTSNSLFGFEFPSSWFQSVNSIFILLLAPAFSWLWMRMGRRQPSSPAKFSAGLLFCSVGMLVMVAAASLTSSGRVSPLWLVSLYFIHTVGELCLSPVGLSTVSRLAPVRVVGMMMGVWFLFSAIGNYSAGWAAGFYRDDAGAMMKLFGGLAVATLIGAVLLAMMTPAIRRLTGESGQPKSD